MPNLASVLKDEIRRLARKEVRAEMHSLKSASAQYRRDIAALKRKVKEHEREIVRLRKAAAKGTAVGSSADSGASTRFSSDWVAKHREKLGLSAADYAALVGVSALTIYNWEHGKSRPRSAQLEAWGAIRNLGKREAWRRWEDL